MKVEIQAFWSAEVDIVKKGESMESAEEYLKKYSHIVLATVLIDGKFRGELIWDGRYLNILHTGYQIPEKLAP